MTISLLPTHWRWLALLLLSLGLAAEPLRIGRSDSHSPLSDQGEALMRRVYGQLGIEVELVRLPTRRSLLLAAGGQLDAELLRIRQIGQEHPDLLRVPIAIAQVELGAYARPGTPVPGNWQALTRYRVAYMRGARFIERHLEPLPHKVEGLDSYDALRLVATRTADIALLPRSEAAQVLAREELSQVREVGFVSEVEPLYHYLHKRHRALLPRLNDALLRLRQQGELPDYESPLLKANKKENPVRDR
ncbi:substrate-binding periplasmic protein [Chitinimonas lacunae]|uniref:Substrate-binding periplasmic protein n=1 Tax=Chitinimonas lacunae TaxID=1963018 RepID=A0ABV8MLN5_9NEIS